MIKYCSNCGHKLDNNAYVCPKCGVLVADINDSSKSKKSNNAIVYMLLGFFVPLVGLILYFTLKKSNIENANASGKGALISVIVSLCFFTFTMILLGILFTVFSGGI